MSQYVKLHELTESTSLSGNDLIEVSKWITSGWFSRRISASFFDKNMSLYATVSANSGIWNLTNSPYLSSCSGDVMITNPQFNDTLMLSGVKWVNVPISNYGTKQISGMLDFLSGSTLTTINSTTADFSVVVRGTYDGNPSNVFSNRFFTVPLYSYSSLADFKSRNMNDAQNGYIFVYDYGAKQFGVSDILSLKSNTRYLQYTHVLANISNCNFVSIYNGSELYIELPNSSDMEGMSMTFCKNKDYPSNTSIKIVNPYGTIANSSVGGYVMNDDPNETYANITLICVGGYRWLISSAHGAWDAV